MDIKIEDIMSAQTIFATPKQTADQIREIFKINKVSVLPVIDHDEKIVGVVSLKEILETQDGSTQVTHFMKNVVYTTHRFENIQTAARLMRNLSIHHLVVTDEKKLVGIVSTFDLLKLLENNVFTFKKVTATTSNIRDKRNLETTM